MFEDDIDIDELFEDEEIENIEDDEQDIESIEEDDGLDPKLGDGYSD